MGNGYVTIQWRDEKNKLTLGDRKRWRPLIPQDVKTDRPIGIDIRVINLGREADFRWLEGIIRRERD